jgi:alpha-D-ribose 1-methylphosphonate 5-triphosphate synthase subunit PhnI
VGYTTVRELGGAIAAASRLAARASGASAGTDVGDLLPLLVDQVQAEAGVAEPAQAARALTQARGDLARAVSLVRAWAATLPREAHDRVAVGSLRAERRITPAVREPDGGQYLGASLDFEQRLLDVEDRPRSPVRATNGAAPNGGAPAPGDSASAGRQDDRWPRVFPRALTGLEGEGLVIADPPARPVDRTRTPVEPGRERGAFLQLLARAETGTMTALAYTAIRGYASRQDPTVADLRVGTVPVHVEHPDGGRVRVGDVAVTVAELVLYRAHDDAVDRRLTLGVGATLGRLERRAVSAALLDAGCARARRDPSERREPCDDEEFLSIALDGQEATGFLEHLKLPHHVTFTSDVDRIRAARGEHGDGTG